MAIDLIILAFSLGIDAFFVALSICLVLQNNIKKLIVFSSLAAFFQALMPLIGYSITYYLNSKYMKIIQALDHYFIFIIFAFLAYKLFKEFLDKNNEKINISYLSLFFLSIATSIDALGAGVMIFSLKYNLFTSIIFIFSITFLMCISSYLLNKIDINKRILQPIGGVFLIFLAFKVVIVHIIQDI